jgi:GNAT superfamily N-acetyltransferase
MHRLLLSMETIEQLLGAGNAPEPHIRTFLPGDLSCIASRHARLYGEEYGFDATFEYYVMAGMASFLKDWSGCGDPRRMGKGNVWVVEQDGLLGGSIAVVETEEKTAQLRWFLLEPEYRGKGSGTVSWKRPCISVRARIRTGLFSGPCPISWRRDISMKKEFSLTETVEHHIWGKNLTEGAGTKFSDIPAHTGLFKKAAALRKRRR